MNIEREEDRIMMDIILDYERKNNIIINKVEMLDYLNKFMSKLNLNWNKLSKFYDEYEVDSWEDLMLKLIEEKLKYEN